MIKKPRVITIYGVDCLRGWSIFAFVFGLSALVLSIISLVHSNGTSAPASGTEPQGDLYGFYWRNPYDQQDLTALATQYAPYTGALVGRTEYALGFGRGRGVQNIQTRGPLPRTVYALVDPSFMLSNTERQVLASNLDTGVSTYTLLNYTIPAPTVGTGTPKALLWDYKRSRHLLAGAYGFASGDRTTIWVHDPSNTTSVTPILNDFGSAEPSTNSINAAEVIDDTAVLVQSTGGTYRFSFLNATGGEFISSTPYTVTFTPEPYWAFRATYVTEARIIRSMTYDVSKNELHILFVAAQGSTTRVWGYVTADNSTALISDLMSGTVNLRLYDGLPVDYLNDIAFIY